MDDEYFFAVVIFHKNTTANESFLPIIGTEIMLLTPLQKAEVHTTRKKEQQDVDSLVYFSEVGSTFRTSSVGSRRYTADTHFAVTIKIIEEEHMKLQKYLVALANENVPYCTASIPIMSFPQPIHWLFSDVFCETASSFKTLTSSQAILFALRNCLLTNRSITCSLDNLHSRFVSPGRLFETIEPFSRPCKVMPLNIAKVVRPGNSEDW
jgi:hypothetical protein